MREPLIVVFALLGVSCGGGSPTLPTSSVSGEGPAVADAAAGTGGVHGAQAIISNSPPELRLKTTPPSSPGDPYPVVSGLAPLTVRFNLCTSSDADQVILPDGSEDPSGDTLNWQFHFGDDGSEAFDEDGSFNAQVGHLCRTEHTYSEAGRYVATVSVTDKHLEDQARDVGSSARQTMRVTVDVGRVSTGSTPAAYCHALTGVTGGGVNVPGVAVPCPTGATEFCGPDPIVSTNGTQARDACEACYGVGQCLANSAAWFNSSFSAGYIFSPIGNGTCAALPGEITNGWYCVSSRWAP